MNKLEWISVEDRLPDNGKTALLLDKNGCFYFGDYSGVDNDWIILTPTFFDLEIKISHWMPLPPPPREGE